MLTLSRWKILPRRLASALFGLLFTLPNLLPNGYCWRAPDLGARTSG